MRRSPCLAHAPLGRRLAAIESDPRRIFSCQRPIKGAEIKTTPTVPTVQRGQTVLNKEACRAHYTAALAFEAGSHSHARSCGVEASDARSGAQKANIVVLHLLILPIDILGSRKALCQINRHCFRGTGLTCCIQQVALGVSAKSPYSTTYPVALPINKARARISRSISRTISGRQMQHVYVHVYVRCVFLLFFHAWHDAPFVQRPTFCRELQAAHTTHNTHAPCTWRLSRELARLAKTLLMPKG